MNKNRFAQSVAVAAGFIAVLAAPGLARTQSTPAMAVQTPSATSPSAAPKGDSIPVDVFAGFTYTDEQKAEIDKIHQDTQTHKNAVEKDDKLNADQKEAMLQGYTRLEQARIFKVLSPEQQRQVHQRIAAHRAATQPAPKPPQN